MHDGVAFDFQMVSGLRNDLDRVGAGVGGLPEIAPADLGEELVKWFLVGALGLLVISPIDAAPDLAVVVGWIDDAVYAAGAVGVARSAVIDRQRRLHLAAGR